MRQLSYTVNVFISLLISSFSALCLVLSHRHMYTHTHTHPLSIANPKDSVLFSSNLNGPPSCDPLFPRPSPASWWGVVFNPLIKYHRGGCNPVRASGSSTHTHTSIQTRVSRNTANNRISSQFIRYHSLAHTDTCMHMHVHAHVHNNIIMSPPAPGCSTLMKILLCGETKPKYCTGRWSR